MIVRRGMVSCRLTIFWEKIAMAVNSIPRPQINERQMTFLEYLIWQSRDANDVTRKLLIWLMRQTDQLTTQVVVNCPPEICKEVSHGLHDMCSGNLTTHLVELFKIAGSAMAPALYNGTYDDDGSLVNDNGFAVFIHDRDCHTPSKRVECDMDAVNAIVAANPYF